MPPEYDYLLASAIASHSVVLFLVGFGLWRNKDKRQRILRWLIPGQGVAFPAVLLLISQVWNPTSLLTLSSYIVYSVVAAFVVAFEIPGYLALSRYDDKIVDALEETRDDLLSLSVSFSTKLSQLKDGWSARKSILQPTYLYPLIDGFVSTCERLNNLDKTFWGLVLNEVNSSIKSFSDRSKHPSPKLIDVLSLSGLSFIIAEFLRLLG